MNTAQVSIELVLAGILALCAFGLPFWRGSELSQNLLQTDALIGILGLAYLFGVVFDKLADTILSPMENYLRLLQAHKMLKRKSSAGLKDAFPQNKLEYQLRSSNDGRLDWMNSLKSRIRTSREMAVLGLPASMGIAIYLGYTRDCTQASSPMCASPWIYLFVFVNLILFIAAAWMEMRTPDEDSTEETAQRIKTGDLHHDIKSRRGQLKQAERQMQNDSRIYYLIVLNSVIGITIVALLKPANSWIALLGAGGLIVSLLSLWASLRITRTYLKFIARIALEPTKAKPE